MKESGRIIKKCKSENEARSIAEKIKTNDPYPVYFFQSETSGEKLYEEFYTKEDKIEMDLFRSLGIITNNVNYEISDVASEIEALKILMNTRDYDKSSIVNLLNEFIPEFHHMETGKSLDQKM